MTRRTLRVLEREGLEAPSDLFTRIARRALRMAWFVVGDVLTDQGTNKAPAYAAPTGGGAAGTFQGRMAYVDTTHVNLGQYNGDTVEVNTEAMALGAGGYTLATTDNLITGAGADAGAAMAVTKLYYIYLGNSVASTFPSTLRGSTTAPTRAPNGAYYLGAAGNALNWRFVGWVYTVSNAGTPNFADTGGTPVAHGQRLVANYYNRVRKDLYYCPGYNDNNATTTYASASGGAAAWVAIRGADACLVEFISNGEDSCDATIFVDATDGNASQLVAIALDGLDPMANVTDHGGWVAVAPAQVWGGSSERKEVLAAGYHTYTMVGSLGAGVFYADFASGGSGAAHDVPGTRIEGSVWV